MKDNLKNEKNRLKKNVDVSIEEKEPCIKELTLKMSKDELGKELESLASEFRNICQVPGFRVGKAPKALIKNFFKDGMEKELIARINRAGIEKAIEEMDLVILYAYSDNPEPPSLKWDEDYSFKICVETAPKYKLPDYKSIHIDIKREEIKPEAVDEEISKLKDLYSTYSKTENPVSKTDIVKISFSTLQDLPDKENLNLSGKALLGMPEAWVCLSEAEIIPGLNSNLEGKKQDEELTFTAEFPEEFKEKYFAGKKLEYRVKILEIQNKIPLSSDGELCSRLKVENIESLKNVIRERLERTALNQYMQKMRSEIVDALNRMTPDEVLPPFTLRSYIRNELTKLANQLVKNDEDIQKFQQEKTKHFEVAKANSKEKLKTYFIMRQIALSEDIIVQENEVQNIINRMSEYCGIGKNIVEKELEEIGAINELKMNILIDKVTDSIIKTILNP